MADDIQGGKQWNDLELEPWTEYESIVRELRAQLIKMGAVIDEVDALAKSKPRSSRDEQR